MNETCEKAKDFLPGLVRDSDLTDVSAEWTDEGCCAESERRGRALMPCREWRDARCF